MGGKGLGGSTHPGATVGPKLQGMTSATAAWDIVVDKSGQGIFYPSPGTTRSIIKIQSNILPTLRIRLSMNFDLNGRTRRRVGIG